MLRFIGCCALLVAHFATAATADVGVVSVPVGETPPDDQVLRKLAELSTAAWAKSQPKRAAAKDALQERLKAAQQAYFSLDFRTAAAELDATLKELESHPEHPKALDLWVSAHLYAALTARELGQAAAADRHFFAVLAVRPELKLSEADFAPPVLAAFEVARDKARNAPSGAVEVSSSPPLAKVTLDEQPRGDAPLQLEGVAVGKHLLALSREGYFTSYEWLSVSPEVAVRQVTLRENPTQKLRERLTGLVQDGASDGIAQAAEALREAMKKETLLVVAAQSSGDLLLVSVLAVESSRARRAAAPMAADLNDAPRVLDALARSLQSASDAPVNTSSMAPAFDFTTHYLGLSPPPKLAVPLTAPAAPTVTASPVYTKAWFWVAIAAGAAAAGTGIYFLARPSQPAPGVNVTVQLP